MISVDEARAKILSRAHPLPSETLFVGDAANRVIAEDMRSERAMPPTDNSAMDGYGVRAIDVATASAGSPQALVVERAILAGASNSDTAALQPERAVRIMTGAPIPPGVDAVVMREDTDESDVREGAGTVRVQRAVASGENVRRRGEDVEKGALVARAGHVMTPARLNLLAQAGHVVVKVHRRPVVAILASGDELRELGTSTSDDDILNSNAHAIAAMARDAYALPQMVGIASDTLEDHVRRIGASAFADVLITIGGVSMGTHDFVRPALEEVGADLSFWKIAMRPGKPLAFGRRGHQLVFGLPGNPVSSQVTFELFVRPALLRLGGRVETVRTAHRAVLVGKRFEKKPGMAFYARAHARFIDGALAVEILGKQGSGQISGLAEANALVVVESERTVVEPGDSVRVLVIDDTVWHHAQTDET
jgi:molybdopterin molybdotransferase